VLVAFDDLEMVSSMKIVPVQLFQALGQHWHLKTINLICRVALFASDVD
jgi:hypothetical protein